MFEKLTAKVESFAAKLCGMAKSAPSLDATISADERKDSAQIILTADEQREVYRDLGRDIAVHDPFCDLTKCLPATATEEARAAFMEGFNEAIQQGWTETDLMRNELRQALRLAQRLLDEKEGKHQ